MTTCCWKYCQLVATCCSKDTLWVLNSGVRAFGSELAMMRYDGGGGDRDRGGADGR